MAKESFVLVSLKEDKAKQLAQAITNDSCRKILNYLSEKEFATESLLSQALGIPLSTVHYNLVILQEAGMVTAEEFHYSEKGKEVVHYKLANKYIIIAPKSTYGLKERIKSLLPVALIGAAISSSLYLYSRLTSRFTMPSAQADFLMAYQPEAALPEAMRTAVLDNASEPAIDTASAAASKAVEEVVGRSASAASSGAGSVINQTAEAAVSGASQAAGELANRTADAVSGAAPQAAAGLANKTAEAAASGSSPLLDSAANKAAEIAGNYTCSAADLASQCQQLQPPAHEPVSYALWFAIGFFAAVSILALIYAFTRKKD